MLKHNHRVLEYFISSGYHSVSREEVLQKGFDFRFFTHMIHEPESHQRIGCYDLSYFITENGMIEIGYSDFEKLLKRNMNARNTHLKSE
jgi:hypothetical protein